MLERESDSATTEKWIVFLHREVRKDLVASHIESAHRDGSRCERLQQLPIDLVLLVLVRKRVAQQELVFRAIEADAFGSAGESRLEIGGQTNIGEQRQPDPVHCFSRKVP